jgi:tetratricopeptide (TPR) repeat protein
MKKVVYLFFVLLFTAVLSDSALAQQMKKEAIKPFNDGLQKSKQGDYKGAASDFEKALQFDNDYRIYYQLAFAQMKLNNTDSAIANFKLSIKANSGYDASYNNLGNVYYSQGKYQDAIDNFEQVIKTSKDSSLKAASKFNIALSYTALASASERDKDYKQAIEYLNKAVKYENYDGAYLALARNYVEASQYDKAISAGLKAIKYKKDISEAGADYYIGVSYSQKGEMKKAKEYLNKAKEDPTYKDYAETVLKAIK